MSDAFQRPTPEHTDWARENRLYEIRREAEQKGRVHDIGVRPPGAPFPHASPETGYYGIPLLKEPPWKWEIPVYFFAGGAAGSAAMIGAAARWVGRDPELARDCRYLTAVGSVLSGALLISDLGRPARFMSMLRVFKRQSPMSVGAWTFAAFATASIAGAFATMLERRFPSLPFRVIGNFSEGMSALAGLPFSNYTGVLIGASVIPAWNENVWTLPVHFGMSGLGAGVGVLELMGHRNRALNALGMGAAAMETLEGVALETRKKPAMDPLKHGPSGLMTRMGGVLSGPVPLALRVAAAFAGKRRARKLRRAAAIASIAGSMLTRVGWLRAGHASAENWRLPLEIEERQHS
jgi:formate-dependent nitrite reductase membrane component NrfD